MDRIHFESNTQLLTDETLNIADLVSQLQALAKKQAEEADKLELLARLQRRDQRIATEASTHATVEGGVDPNGGTVGWKSTELLQRTQEEETKDAEETLRCRD